MRVAVYARVSTSRQAAADLSVPDQLKQMHDYCAGRGWDIVKEFIEPGDSATDDARPVFQDMMDWATSRERPVDIVLVHSYSRFMREAYLAEYHIRRLRKANIQLVSITQETGDGSTGDLIRRIILLFDEYSSKENAKHTLRAMRTNAADGFWNGSKPPFGYQVVEAEKRGDKIKKRLQIDPDEAPLVKWMFEMALKGTPDRGRLGVQAISAKLNSMGLRHRGRRFHTSFVHKLLTNPVYSGVLRFNQRCAKTRALKSVDEVIKASVPAIISVEDFQRLQEVLSANSPKKRAPRVLASPTLLTGILKCASCGGAMTISTGKGGRYRYYACSRRQCSGVAICRGRRVPMEKLDTLVIDAFCRQVLAPERLLPLFQGVLDSSATGLTERRARLDAAKREQAEAQKGMERLLGAIESGLLSLDDVGLKDRLQHARTRLTTIQETIDGLERQLTGGLAAVTPEKVEAFGRLLSDSLRKGSPAFRKAYLRLLIDRIELDDDEVRMTGPIGQLERALEIKDFQAMPVVPTSVEKWRPLRDSNPCRRRERAVS